MQKFIHGVESRDQNGRKYYLENLADTEIANFYWSFSCYQQIIRLYISMNNILKA